MISWGRIKIFKPLITLFIVIVFINPLCAAPAANLWKYWDKYNAKSLESIDYSSWQIYLDKYVQKKGNQTYVDYAKITNVDKVNLDNTINNYASLNILDYNRDQQLAYWINMYNMLTIQTILKHYPVKSITDMDKGWFGSSKVWDKGVVNINGKKLTLNDIEHRIIRPIWHDPRVHSAVNCASVSCPNLAKKAYQGSIIDKQLDSAFSAWVNSTKGVELEGGNIYLSKIFDWYGSDFGNQTQMRKFIAGYINNNKTKGVLLDDKHSIFFKEYNWNLNEV